MTSARNILAKVVGDKRSRRAKYIRVHVWKHS